MAVFKLSVFKCHTHSVVSGDQPNQAVELRLQRYSRLVPGPPSAAYIQQILEETTFAHDDQPTPTTTNVIPLPLHVSEADPAQFEIDLAQLLSSLHICATAREMIVREITRAVRETAEGEGERRLCVVAEVDGVELSWTRVEREVVEQEDHDDPPDENEEKSEICSICLDELNNGKWDEIEVGCGHVYHHFCIYNWLIHNSTCPLCRAPLELED